MESTISFLKRRLREAGASRWELIAAEAGVAKTLPRKIACNDRNNPGVNTVQPLLDYFNAQDRLTAKKRAKPTPTTHPKEAAHG